MAFNEFLSNYSIDDDLINRLNQIPITRAPKANPKFRLKVSEDGTLKPLFLFPSEMNIDYSSATSLEKLQITHELGHAVHWFKKPSDFERDEDEKIKQSTVRSLKKEIIANIFSIITNPSFIEHLEVSTDELSNLELYNPKKYNITTHKRLSIELQLFRKGDYYDFNALENSLEDSIWSFIKYIVNLIKNLSQSQQIKFMNQLIDINMNPNDIDRFFEELAVILSDSGLRSSSQEDIFASGKALVKILELHYSSLGGA